MGPRHPVRFPNLDASLGVCVCVIWVQWLAQFAEELAPNHQGARRLMVMVGANFAHLAAVSVVGEASQMKFPQGALWLV